jgi:predicted transcriptional regulator
VTVTHQVIKQVQVDPTLVRKTNTRKVRKRVRLDPLVTQLRERREALGVGRKAVARMAGVAPDTVRHLEDGWTGGTLDVIRAIATALGCDLQLVAHDQEGVADVVPVEELDR